MCVAIVKPAGAKVPSRETLKICFKNNPDGAGFAFYRNGKNHLHKGYFTFGSFWDAFCDANIQEHESALIHFRVATHGNIDKHTCHPFLITSSYDDMKEPHIVTKNGDIMIHNGMLNFDLDDDDISDSMYLAKLLSNYDLSIKSNASMLNIALLNNNKSKMNRVGILRINNTTEIYGFKEPWELVEGCYFSNKSYMINFSRGTYYYANATVTEQDRKEKLDYDEDKIQSKKVDFCYNHDNGTKKCDELGIYAVHYDEKNYHVYCEECIDKVDYFNCKYCKHTYYTDQRSIIHNICKNCFETNSEFLMDCKCFLCESAIAKHVVYGNTNDKNQIIHLCDKCFENEMPFKCSECNHWHSYIDISEIENLCVDCYEKTTQVKECCYCKSKHNLLKTAYSIVCKKCFEEKNGHYCHICKKPYTYGSNSIDGKHFCSTCFSNYSNKHIMENFKSYALLNDKVKEKLKKLFDEADEKKKLKCIDYYMNNNYFSYINKNANVMNEILKG